MKTNQVHEAVKCIVWIAASYYPLHTFYGASIWQATAIFAITAGGAALLATLAAFWIQAFPGRSDWGTVADRAVMLMFGVSCIIMPFYLAMSWVVGNTNPIQDTVILITCLTASGITSSILKLATGRLAFA